MQLTCLNARHPFAVRIGSGVGSEHYLALQQGEGESFRRLVMVKKLSSLLRDAARAEMMREIRAAASLSHPNVVQVFGALFMTLGCSLSAILVLQTIAAEKEAHLLASLRTACTQAFPARPGSCQPRTWRTCPCLRPAQQCRGCILSGVCCPLAQSGP